jgi:hypothetical protein
MLRIYRVRAGCTAVLVLAGLAIWTRVGNAQGQTADRSRQQDTVGVAIAEGPAKEAAPPPPAAGAKDAAAPSPAESPFKEETPEPAPKTPGQGPADKAPDKGPADAAPDKEPAPKGPETAPAGTVASPPARCLTDEDVCAMSDFIARFGFWGSSHSGSPAKVGEYQDLGSSPFFDVDGFRSNGKRTLDYTITGTDNESTAARLDFYQPRFRANLDYQRYPHQLGHDPLNQFVDVNRANNLPQDSFQTVKEDLNVGQDYAIRVQELKARFKGQVTKDLKVRLDVWGMEKEGTRQAVASTFCFRSPDHYPGRKCHDLSQSQRIDWRTTEVKPVVEWDLGPVVLEYSRPMRSFSQDDQVVTRTYQGTAFGSTDAPVDLPYAVVPESFTQIDQLKMSAELGCDDKFYTLLFLGNTHKESDALPPGNPPERVGNRHFGGADVRWTNTSIENVTITTYGRIVTETNEPVAFAIHGEEDTPDTNFNVLDQQPINYQRTQLGTKALWRPFGRGFGLGGLAIDGGYEYSVLHRTFATFPLERLDPPPPVTVNEENTIGNMVFLGPSVRWSAAFDTYARYKWYGFHSPLYAIQEASGATNSALPDHENVVEIGGTWVPSDCFMLNAWFSVDVRQNHGAGRFDEQDYPFGVNGWYAVSEKWSLSAGYAYYTNWINQTINIGTRNDPDTSIEAANLLQTQWKYGGRASVFNLGSTYRATRRLKLVGSAEYVTGINSAYLVSGPAFLSDVPSLIAQDVQTTRFSAGADYQWRPRIGTYFRYVLFDYRDRSAGLNSGTSNMFLGGVSAIF